MARPRRCVCFLYLKVALRLSSAFLKDEMTPSVLIYSWKELAWRSYPKVETGGLCRHYRYCSRSWSGCCVAC
jgi:hypothetical protein